MKRLFPLFLFAALNLLLYSDLYGQSAFEHSKKGYENSTLKKKMDSQITKSKASDPFYRLNNSPRKINRCTTEYIYTISVSTPGGSYTLYYGENEKGAYDTDYRALIGAKSVETIRQSNGRIKNPNYHGGNQANDDWNANQADNNWYDDISAFSNDDTSGNAGENTLDLTSVRNQHTTSNSTTPSVSLNFDDMEAYFISNPSQGGIQIGDGIMRPREDYPSLPDSTYNKLPAPNDYDGGPNANFFLRGQQVDGYHNGEKMEQIDKELGKQLYDLLNNPKYEWQSIVRNFSLMQTYSLYSLLANENGTGQIPALRHDLAQNAWLFMADNGNFYKISKDENNLMVIEKTTYNEPEFQAAILGNGVSARYDFNQKTLDIDCKTMISGGFDFKEKQGSMDILNVGVAVPFNYAEKSKITISEGGDVQNNNVKLLSGANVGVNIGTDGVDFGTSYDLVNVTFEKQQLYFDGNNIVQRSDKREAGVNFGISNIGGDASSKLTNEKTANNLNTMPLSDDFKNKVFKEQVQNGISYLKNQASLDDIRKNAEKSVSGQVHNISYTPAKIIKQKVMILENIYLELNSGNKTYKDYLK